MIRFAAVLALQFLAYKVMDVPFGWRWIVGNYLITVATLVCFQKTTTPDHKRWELSREDFRGRSCRRERVGSDYAR